MDVPTITMDKDEAAFSYEEYRAALEGKEPSAEDAQIMLGYKALAAGKQILDLHAAFRTCAVDAEGLPKLAVGRASWRFCLYCMNGNRAAFAPTDALLARKGNTGKVAIPRAFMPTGAKIVDSWRSRRALVPTIPLPLRPKADLHNYHILWEAEWQRVAPTDPILLKKLAGSLYVVLAMWDLTELERAVLAGRFLEQQ